MVRINTSANKQFCKSWGEVQNSTFVLLSNICTKFNFSASISQPSQSCQNVTGKRRDERISKIIPKIKRVFVLFFANAHLAHLVFANAQTNHEKPKELNFPFATNSQTHRLFYRIKFKIKSGAF